MVRFVLLRIVSSLEDFLILRPVPIRACLLRSTSPAMGQGLGPKAVYAKDLQTCLRVLAVSGKLNVLLSSSPPCPYAWRCRAAIDGGFHQGTDRPTARSDLQILRQRSARSVEHLRLTQWHIENPPC